MRAETLNVLNDSVKSMQGDYAVHQKRYVETLNVICDYILQPTETIVDCGGESPLTAALRDEFGSARVVNTGDAELRVEYDQPLPSCEPKSAGIILCTEVLEHLADTQDAPRGQFTFDGVLRVIHAIKVTLKNSASIVLFTTPNVNSWVSVHRTILGDTPFMYPPHVRELTLHEITKCLLSLSLEIRKTWTSDVWGRAGMPQHKVLALKSLAENWDVQDVERGDCRFIVAGLKGR